MITVGIKTLIIIIIIITIKKQEMCIRLNKWTTGRSTQRRGYFTIDMIIAIVAINTTTIHVKHLFSTVTV